MATRKHQDPEAGKLTALAEALITDQSTMTLATAEGEKAWAAPVYYTYLKPCFYFFSDPESRHIQEALANGQASSAIHVPATSWQGIRGIQMSGTVDKVPPGLRAVEAIQSYLRKFPFTKEFFDSGQALDLAAFSRRFRVRLYRFRPGLVYYMDNSLRFGFRERVEI